VPRPKNFSERDAEARREEAKIKYENSVLERMVALDREIRKPANPIRRRQPKVTRMQSKRMQEIQQQTNNPIRAIFQTPEQAERGTITGEPDVTTREVGPGDLYNNNYGCEGKETGSRYRR
jgi:hypothetical protein